jgi:hypothetical protein
MRGYKTGLPPKHVQVKRLRRAAARQLKVLREQRAAAIGQDAAAQVRREARGQL